MANNTTIGNVISKVNLTQAKEILHRCYNTERKTGIRVPPFFLGAPGNGKSSIVEQFTQELDTRSRANGGPGTICLSFRLGQCDPTDLKGVPVYDEVNGARVCTFAPPRNFPLKGLPDSADGKEVVLFLDELPQATPTIQNLASNIIDGKVGDYEIDMSRCFIVLAGNRKEDKAATFETPTNVRNRVATIAVNITFAEWEDWAINKGISPFVVGYLKSHTEFFNSIPPDVGSAYATPRSWEKVSADLISCGDSWTSDLSTLNFLVGLVGTGVAHDFYQFVTSSKDKFRLEDIIHGKPVPIPDQATTYRLIYEAVYQLNTWMLERIDDPTYLQSPPSQKSEVLTQLLGPEKIKGINNIYTWVNQKGIDPGFQVLLNRFQKGSIKHALRSVFRQPEFAPAQSAWNDIHTKLVTLSNGAST